MTAQEAIYQLLVDLSVARAQADTLTRLARSLPANHPDRRFVLWLTANAHRLHAATADLGLPFPAPGPILLTRLRNQVLPHLHEDSHDNASIP